MLELTIRCKCVICDEPIVIESLKSDFDLYHMKNNRTREKPFFAYHHEGFGGEKGFAIAQCAKCDAEYSVSSGVISIICSADDVDKKLVGDTPCKHIYKCSTMTFPKWLKNQRHRADVVGALSGEAFYTDGHSREYKKQMDREFPGRPKKATEYEEWVKFLNGKSDALASFYIAWAEYQYLKEYCRMS